MAVLEDLAAAGEELLAKATTLRDTLQDAGDLTREAIDDIASRLQVLAVDIDALIHDVQGEDDDGEDDDEPAPEDEAPEGDAGSPV